MDTVTINEEEGEETYGDEDHAVELVTGTHKNPHYSKVYRRNTRDKLHVEIDVRTTTDEDTMSAVAKLHGCNRRVDAWCHRPQTYSRNKCGEKCAHFLSRQAACQKQVDDESLQGEGRIHEEKSMSSILPNNVSTDNSENHFLIREG